ncbi:CHAT domain-containing protein [Methanosarcina sp.]|uniref:CHAT domain-containing protein n=1 Tax=Methanosarcina sp. TaxID=2213 RepID=UPI0029881D5A|nr:CHAT domain-containing protein [Methanosarcina sp.]MDW5551503.1 CHAT domain-containing protein [Methanosarcina sp.]MDW5555405.1 CHAT domain-containing protein [Methanosarcina sp.]MDW5560042.1 CHAT domain-containing protein [Methanosarcina sp.]
MVEIEFTDPNQRVQKLIEYFDLNLERNMDFDIGICFHDSDQNCEEEKNLKDLLDELIQNERGWDKISVSCRRMIICDRELDLEKGLKVLAESLPLFNSLLALNDNSLIEPEKVAENIVNGHKNKMYEVIRYVNTCGLIFYRSGDYSKALKFFKLAECIGRNKKSLLSYFIPDTTSNRIRTEFEFVSQSFLGQITEDSVEMYGKKLIDFIDSYKNEVNEWGKRNFEQDGETKNWIYGHGMASLYHNLAEAYSFVINKSDNSPLLKVIFKEYAIRANEASLNKYGSKEKYTDIYRQLQSKNALRRLGRNVEKYENDLLGGKWERGKLMVYQDKIKSEGDKLKAEKIKLKAEEFELKAKKYKIKVEEIIDEGIKEGYFKIKMSDDKIGMLHNLSSIQYFMKVKPFTSIMVEGKELKSFDISVSKIKVAEELRHIFSPILYKRQVLKLIREDISLVINDCIENEEYSKALNFNDFYTNRGLIDISTVKYNDEAIQFDTKIKSIDKLKREINLLLEKDAAQKNDIGDHSLGETSIVLGSETDGNFLKLVLEYEDILKALEINHGEERTQNYKGKFSPNSIEEIYFEDVIKSLEERLGEIPENENTIVVKFLIHNLEESVIIRMFVLDRWGINKPVEVKYPKEDYKKYISKVNTALEIYKKTGTEVEFLKSEVPNEIAELAKAFSLYDKLDRVKNIFFVPDGELFQIPLHLLGNEGTDLRTKYSVYYASSLTHLMKLNINKSSFSKKERSCLWLCAPTKDLFATQNVPCLYKPKDEGKKITLLEYADGTLGNFYEKFEHEEYTNIGFSTHAAFHDNVVTAYVSLLRFYDSFLTTYDILLFMDLRGVETVFLGACCGASTKFTDENEAVGLVTAFLSKGADSVIAPLCPISSYIHNSFINLLNDSNIIYTSQSWNLDTCNIFRSLKKNKVLNENKFVYFVPFIQYASLDIVGKRGVE